MIVSKNNANILVNLPRFSKKLLALLCDFNLCLICLVAAFYLRIDQLVPLRGPVLTASLVSVCIALPIFWLMGIYRTIFRYSGMRIIFSLSMAILIYGCLYFIVATLYGIQGVPRSIGIIQPIPLLLPHL